MNLSFANTLVWTTEGVYYVAPNDPRDVGAPQQLAAERNRLYCTVTNLRLRAKFWKWAVGSIGFIESSARPINVTRRQNKAKESVAKRQVKNARQQIQG